MDLRPLAHAFVSLVMVVRNQATGLRSLVTECSEKLRGWVGDHEIILVDNGSIDETVVLAEALTAVAGVPNVQVFVLSKPVDRDTAVWAGVERSLGDYVIVFDPLTDALDCVPTLLERAQEGYDIVLGRNGFAEKQSLAYAALEHVFDAAYRRLTGVSLQRDAPSFRLLSRRVVNYTLRHAAPSVAYRYVSVASGFPAVTVEYTARPRTVVKKSLGDAVDRGIKLVVSTTALPMRLAAGLALFGAGANAVYSVYVILIALFKRDVAAGWVTLSLQQAGMFFLISLVLFILAEYLVSAVPSFSGAPSYHIVRELTSSVVDRLDRLNVERADSALPPRPDPAKRP